MSIAEKISEKQITCDLDSKSINEIFRSLAAIINSTPVNKNIDLVVEKLKEREELGSTGVGFGVALPHMKYDFINEVHVSFGMSREGIEFKAVDGEPVHYFFLVLGPAKAELQEEYLKTMAEISRLMRQEEVRTRIKECKNTSEILDIFKDADKNSVVNKDK